MMKVRFLLALCVLPIATLAQNSLKGRVIDAESNRPLEQVLIYNSRTQLHSHSNSSGDFMLQPVRLYDTLQLSLLGYGLQQHVVSSLEAPLRIFLKPKQLTLEEVVITADLNTFSTVSAIDVTLNPVNSSQDLLRKVPGLFIGQHAGGGKAEQIFLRGFDIDHGTDIQITADGIPVNMVSHAHGQGYADLHFLIPETVKAIDFGKGPYYASKGNFSTAGYVAFNTYDKLPESTITLELGRWNTKRLLGLVDLMDRHENSTAYLATEYVLTDGAFEAPQHFRRLNLFGKYTTRIKDNLLSLQLSTFTSRWDASGQIPERAVRSGLISRFGAIDNTEGGQTGRTNVLTSYRAVLEGERVLETKLFYSRYDFELYSNFTFFLNNPLQGDQIRQREQRDLWGFGTSLYQPLWLGNQLLNLELSAGFRYDQIADNELSRTLNRRQILESITLGNIEETNGYAYANLEWEKNNWLLIGGLRLDYLNFLLEDQLQPAYQTQGLAAAVLSPKFNVLYTPSSSWQLYLKSGKSFHSNDTHVVLAQGGRQTLPAAYGADLGTLYKPFRRLYLNAALWMLYLEQEFVYVGDEGVVEPSGQTLRRGADLGLRYQLSQQLFADADLSYARPESLYTPEGEHFIPLAPTFTSSGGLSLTNWKGLSGSLRYRYLADRAANEDRSVLAEGYFLADLNLNYRYRKTTLGISVENLFNTQWREAQFLTESRLQDEEEPVEEIHFTPGVPFFIKCRLSFNF